MGKLKIGIIGLDTSHVIAFTKLLNNPDDEHHVPGAEVVVAFPGGSRDMELSYTRVEGFTNQLREDFAVEIVDSIESVAEKSDAILLESVDGRVHRDQFEKIAPFKKPVFIDKPFATSSSDAREIKRLADQYQTPVMSSSALRYSVSVSEAIEASVGQNPYGLDAYGPLALEANHGLFWYGIHTAEILYRALGTGCKQVTVTKTADHDLIVGEWQDGRIGTLRGNRKGNNTFGAMIHTEAGTHQIDVTKDPKPFYAGLLDEIIPFFKTGKSPIDIEETLEIARFLEAANESRELGKTVLL